MARKPRKFWIDSRTARAKLALRTEPYWIKISTGCYLGYRKNRGAGSWVGRWRNNSGNQTYHRLGAADDTIEADGVLALSFDQAQAKARDWFQEAAHLAVNGRPRGKYTIADCLEDYAKWAQAHRKSAHHVATYARAFISSRLGNIDTADLTTRLIADWHIELASEPPRIRSKRGQSPRHRSPDPDPSEARRKAQLRANNYLSILRAALNRAWRTGTIEQSRDVWMRVAKFRGVDRPRSNYLTEDQALLLANACGPGLRELVQVALLTGARYSELCALDCRDFDARSGTLLIRMSKNGRPRHIVLSDEGIELCRALTTGHLLNQPLLRREDGSRWARDLHRRPFKEAAARIGLDPSFTFHELRHTWASLAVMNGAELIVVATNLGHRDTRMVERVYGHLTNSYVSRRVRETGPRYGFTAATNVVPLRGG